MIIRQASLRDSTAIHRLLIQLGYPPQNDAFIVSKIENYTTDGYRLLVCDIDNETVGFISLHWFDIFHSNGKMGRITAFCVSEHIRGEGIGQHLLKAAEEILFSHGCLKVEVTSNFKRTLTHEFYLKNGYTEDSKRFVKTLSGESQEE
jgi:GNAT superfamily N-acetyltransferase